jgi:hypothetical protein
MKKKGAGGPSNRNPLPLFNAANPSPTSFVEYIKALL